MLLVIANPAAAGGRCRRRSEVALGELERAGIDHEVHWTARAGDASRRARLALESGGRDLAVAGGDGTIFEVLNGLLPATPQLPRSRLGLLPFGTGNSFAADLGVVADPRGAAQQLARSLREERTLAVDVLDCSFVDRTRYCLGALSLGFPSDVAALVNRRLKRFGVFGYTLGVLLCLSRLRTLELSFESDEGILWQGPATFLCLHNNPTFGGNMKMAPAADPTDGVGDWVVCRPEGRLELLKTFPRLFAGTHTGHPSVSQGRFRRLEIETGGAREILLDGEVHTLRLRSIEVLPEAIECFVGDRQTAWRTGRPRQAEPLADRRAADRRAADRTAADRKAADRKAADRSAAYLAAAYLGTE